MSGREMRAPPEKTADSSVRRPRDRPRFLRGGLLLFELGRLVLVPLLRGLVGNELLPERRRQGLAVSPGDRDERVSEKRSRGEQAGDVFHRCSSRPSPDGTSR